MPEPLTLEELGVITDYFTYEEQGLADQDAPYDDAMTARHRAAERVCEKLDTVTLCNMTGLDCKELCRLLDVWRLLLEADNEAVAANRDAQEAQA